MKSACVLFSFIVCVVLFPSIAEGKTWALLTAGSNTWDNYRHQVYSSVYIYIKFSVTPSNTGTR